jgi:hypothetical protein
MKEVMGDFALVQGKKFYMAPLFNSESTTDLTDYTDKRMKFEPIPKVRI